MSEGRDSGTLDVRSDERVARTVAVRVRFVNSSEEVHGTCSLSDASLVTCGCWKGAPRRQRRDVVAVAVESVLRDCLEPQERLH